MCAGQTLRCIRVKLSSICMTGQVSLPVSNCLTNAIISIRPTNAGIARTKCSSNFLFSKEQNSEQNPHPSSRCLLHFFQPPLKRNRNSIRIHREGALYLGPRKGHHPAAFRATRCCLYSAPMFIDHELRHRLHPVLLLLLLIR